MHHKDQPWNKGIWVWNLDRCMGGNIDAIIGKCKDFDISYLLIKGGDGEKTFPQLTREVVVSLQNSGIKVYSWTYNYGLNPLAEADVAIKCLDLGVDGHVFDAESEYEHLANNTQVAEAMLQTVRTAHPTKFLAYSTNAIIDLHRDFPYLTFGKYCDAVMPQVYWGKWINEKVQQSPSKAFLWVYDNFIRWHQNWIDSGHSESVKPIIPTGQVFDDHEEKTRYVAKPADIHAFINTVKGYKSANFWSFQHLLRPDCWEALRDAKLDPPTDADMGRVVVASESEQPAQVTTEAPQETVAAIPEETPVEIIEPAVIETSTTQPDGTTVTVVEQVETTLPDGVTVVTPEEVVETAPAAPVDTQTVTPQNKPQTVDLPGSINVPITEKTTITVKPDSSHPDGVKITVTTHKTHQDMFIEFIRRLFSLFRRK